MIGSEIKHSSEMDKKLVAFTLSFSSNLHSTFEISFWNSFHHLPSTTPCLTLDAILPTVQNQSQTTTTKYIDSKLGEGPTRLVDSVATKIKIKIELIPTEEINQQKSKDKNESLYI